MGVRSWVKAGFVDTYRWWRTPWRPVESQGESLCPSVINGLGGVVASRERCSVCGLRVALLPLDPLVPSSLSQVVYPSSRCYLRSESPSEPA